MLARVGKEDVEIPLNKAQWDMMMTQVQFRLSSSLTRMPSMHCSHIWDVIPVARLLKKMMVEYLDYHTLVPEAHALLTRLKSKIGALLE